MDAEHEIRNIIEARTLAVRDKDVDALMAQVHPSALSFDVVDPLQYAGADAARARAKEWFASFAGPIDLEVRDLRIEAGDDVAYCHSLNRLRGVFANGDKVDMWVRSTVCLKRLEGRWKILHQHTSVPFDGKTGMASLNLEPL
jgi:ketosteroid isomerase-like protein